MKNAANDRIRRLLPLPVPAGLAPPASEVSARFKGTCLLLALVTSFSTVAHAGQGVWTSGGPFGGTITALAIDPATPATLYAGTGDNRGVFKSTDSGGTWAAAGTGLTDPYVAALAIDPSNPATLYAGTIGAGGGVFKTVDGGGVWTGINTGLTFGYVYAFAVDPSAPATLYAGTNGGVYKSTNGGGTWAAANAGLTTLSVTALAIDPATPTTLYAGTAGAGRGVYKSTNGGGSWSPVTANVLGGVTDVNALAIDPSAPATLYAGTTSRVLKSTDGGGSWTAISASLPAPASFSALAIDPSTPATLYVLDLGSGTPFKSTDGGGSWAAANTGLSSAGRALAVDPSAPATLYAGTLAGVFKSTSGAGSWTATSTGLGATVGALAVDPSAPTTLYAGGPADARVLKSTDGGGSWTEIWDFYSRLQALAIDTSAPTTLYAGTGGGSDFFYDYPGVYKSTDGGANWRASLSASVFALAVDPLTPATLYAGIHRFSAGAGPGGGVVKSTNGGASWSAADTGLLSGPNAYVRALAIDPATPATLYAGMVGGGAFKSTDAAGSWSAVNAGLTSANVRALVIEPSAPATVYAGTDGGIFKSSNGGGTWASANTGLTSLSVTALAIDPTAPATLYAGTLGGGVFRSTDSGGSWAAFNDGLPNLNVNALALGPGGATTVYAGLEAGSVWQLTAPTTGTVTALLPASARAAGANGAFYTTNVAVANTGTAPASFTLKFLGHDQDGSNGPERSFDLDPGKSTDFADVLGSVFNQTSNFGAIRITSNSSALGIVSVTSTPGSGGTFGQTIPVVSFADLVPAGSARSILYVREGDGFRSNLVLASGAFVATHVDVALLSPAGATLATKTYSLPPNGMTQVNRVVRDMGVTGPVTGARLVLSSSTAGAAFTGVASVIDETTNDPTAMPALPASVSGFAPYVWLLPASAHASGLGGAFYTTNVAVANVGAAPASFTMTFLGGNVSAGTWDYLRQGTEQTFNLESGKSVIYFDVLAAVFNETSGFGAIRITSNTAMLNIVSVTTTPGFGGTFGQTIPAVFSADLISAGSSRSILSIREGDGFRSNLILASNAGVATSVDAALVSPAGAVLATKGYVVPPHGMTQINRIVLDMGVPGPVTGARLVLSSSTPGAAFTAFASVIDETTNDSIAVEAR